MLINTRGLFVAKSQVGCLTHNAPKANKQKPPANFRLALNDKPYRSSISFPVASLQSSRTFTSAFSSFWEGCGSFFSNIFCSQDTTQKEKKLGQIARQFKYVWFYDEKQNPLTSFLGNFYPCKVRVWNMNFACSEAAFQAGKFYPDRALMASFSNLNGDQAFQRSKQLTATWTPAHQSTWRARNLPVMEEIVRAKFQQNPHLARLLLATGDAHLIERTSRDSFWGDGDGSGLNKLGEILMGIRRELGGSGFRPRPSYYRPSQCV